MTRLSIAVAVGIVAGFVAGRWLVAEPLPATDAAPRYFDASSSMADRIEALERVVAEERNARMVLEETLATLFAEIDRLAPTVAEAPRAREAQAGDAPEPAEERGRRFGRLSSGEERLQRFVDQGFSPERAAAILARENALRMQALQAEYEAEQQGLPFDALAENVNPQWQLRKELGDDDYARYLTASGRRATVVVADVMEASPASRAGLRRGDQILGYDGNRVFSMTELKNHAFDGAAGEDVLLDIERDGVRMQVVVPRGPLGIMGSGGGVNFGGRFGG